MSRDRIEELWLRFLAYGMLAPDEGRELLQAMESDPGLRAQLLGDRELDGLLRSMGAGDGDAEGFVKGMSELPAAENDEAGFLTRLQTRMDREGILQGKPGAGKIGPHFGNPGFVQYNSSRTSMPAIVNLEGSEEDFARLLVFHRIVSDDQIQKALEDRQTHAAKGGKVETLRDTLLRTKAVSSALLFDVLREASKVVETCTKCSAVHQIVYYHPTSRYFCTFCKGTMRVTDPGQSMKWKPGELAASVNELSGTFQELPAATSSNPTPSAILRAGLMEKPAANPLDDPSSTGIRGTKSAKPTLPPLPEDDKVTLAPGGDETMLDMGVTPRTSSKPKPLPKLPTEGSAPKPPPPPPAAPPKESAPGGLPSWMDNDESLLDYGSPKAAKPPAEPPKPATPAPKAPEPSGLPSWMDNDESLLDYGSPKARKPADPMAGETPRTSSKPFELPKDKPTEAAPAGERSIGMVPGGGETMLDMGSAKPFSLPKDKPAAAAPPADRSIGNIAGGGETMLGMGDTPRTSSKPKTFELPKDKKPAEAAPTVDRSIGPLPDGGGTTMLDMGSSGRKPGDAPAINPDASIIPVPGAGETMLDMGGKKNVGDGSTSIMGSKRAIPAGIPKAPSELPKLPGSSSTSTSNPAYDVTTKQGTTKTEGTFMLTPSTGSSSSTVDRTQIQQTTPKTGSGGSSAAIANAKALPPEVAQAAKDTSRVFGKYILMSELGRGGAGVVYKAWDTLILQYVALKFIRYQDDDTSDTSTGSSQIEEFQREARMSVRLRHPNIVRIYELGCMSNRYYLSMEYIEGGTLLALIHGGKDRNTKTRFNSDPLKFLKIMQNIAMAVDYAHNTKPPIIHRDLKPHNVLVDTKGNPYVVDFGLAKEVDQGDGATLTGVVKGTPTYMAPEQAEGRNRDVDPRTDVYSLGAILYEMLTGRPPYTGESVPEILRKIATELPERPNDVITKNAIAAGDTTSKLGRSKTKGLLVPKPLETICLKALEKGKADRYQSAKEFGDDIERYLNDEDILAQEPGLYRRIRRKIRQHPLLSAAAAVVLATGLTGGIMVKTLGKDDGSGKRLIESIVERGDQAIKRQDWVTLRGAADDLARQDKQHAKIALFEAALKDHRDLVEKTERAWSAHLDRIRREPLAKVLPGLREEFRRCPELMPKFRDSLTFELNALKGKVLDDARKLIGTGARPAWVEDLVKTTAREGKEQLETLLTLANDPDFKYPTEALVTESSLGLSQVIAYQGTWSLQVNVAPFAEVTVSRAEKEVSTEFTPLGLQELEVVGSSYIVELCWPSRENAQLKVKQEIKDLHHGQTVVIRGDLSKATLVQERK
jgi:serine/threonine protein kinase